MLGVSEFGSRLHVGWWACWAHGVPIVLALIGVGLIGLKRVVLRGDQNVLDDMVVVGEGGAGGHRWDGAVGMVDGAVSGRRQFCL